VAAGRARSAGLTFEIRPGSLDADPGRTLAHDLWLELGARYADDPHEQETEAGSDVAGDDLESHQLAPPTGAFLVGFDEAGMPVACGGVRRHDDGVGEIKRMYVVPEARGQGHSRALLGALEDAARDLGYRALVLESGVRQPEALSLYESAGYRRIDSYGFYRDSPLSVCFRKEL
jgi:GNAT superfamily N-acetyltransferase